MKAGTENRMKVVFALILLAAAVLLFMRMLAGWNSESDVQPATTTPAAATPKAARGRRGKPVATPSLDPRLRLNLLPQSEQVEYKGAGRNIFDRASTPDIEKPIHSAKKETPPPVPTGPPPPPPPPQINLKFFGFANSTGEPRQVFLAQGDDVFVAKEGDIVNRRYKVLRIMPNSVEIEDVLNNNRQTIPLTQG